MAPDQNCIDFIKSREGFKNLAYKDSAGIWTIGYGSIVYETGRKVMKGDNITIERAEALLRKDVEMRAARIEPMLRGVVLTQNQFNALLSFAYNVGIGALEDSTLLKRVKANPNDPTIKDAFMMWNKVHKDGKMVAVEGLTNRRKAEADLYFS